VQGGEVDPASSVMPQTPALALESGICSRWDQARYATYLPLSLQAGGKGSGRGIL
jgi:hypothetical protein